MHTRACCLVSNMLEARRARQAHFEKCWRLMYIYTQLRAYLQQVVGAYCVE
jgi:hypothetical protein